MTDLPNWSLRRREHLQQLRRVLQAPDFLPDGAAIAALEQDFSATWKGLRVRGIVDRVDRTPEGIALVDYKTRASKPVGAKDGSGKTRLDVQIPLYLQAAAPALFPGEAVAAAHYYSLTRARKLPAVRIDDEALTALAGEVETRLREGAYPVAPDVERNACHYCDFDLLCRRGPRLERKESGTAP